jgi:MFS family permease
MRRLLLLVCSITLADTILYAALVPLLPHYADEFGLSKSQAGLIVGAYAFGALVGAIPGGIAAARYGPRRAVLAGLVLMAVASVGFGFAGSGAELGIARLAQGFGSALSWTGALAWLVAGTPRDRRGEMLGTAIGAAIFGALLGPALGAVAEAVGTRPAFVGVAGVSAGLIVWALRTPAVAAESQSPRALLGAVRQPLILGALWLMVLPALLFGVMAVLVPLELGDAGWGAAAIAALFIGAAAIEMVVAPLLGRFSDRRGRLLPLRLASGAAIVVTSGLALAGRPVFIAPLVVAAAIAFGSFWAPAMALLSDGADRIGLAQALGFGLMNAAWGAGNSLGPAVGGALADVAGDAFPFALMAGVCGLTLLALTRGRHLFGTPLARVPESS